MIISSQGDNIGRVKFTSFSHALDIQLVNTALIVMTLCAP